MWLYKGPPFDGVAVTRSLVNLAGGLGVVSGFLLRLQFLGLGGLLLEAIDAAFSIDEFLLSCEEGMAVGTDFDAQVAFVGRTRRER